MPSLFERVGRSLTRKKPEINTNTRNQGDSTTVGEGAQPVSPNGAKGYVPPIRATSPSQEKSSGAFQSFIRSKSPQRNAAPPPVARTARAPLLSLHLPELSEKAGVVNREKLGIVFEAPPDPAYSDDIIASKRLNTAETISLVQKTSSALIKGGLETPGIFKSFWHKQSADSQRKLIIAFLQALSTIDTPSGEEDAAVNQAVEDLNARLASTSPYDVAEVFKWALRHFNHDGASFGTSSEWYKTFAEAEKTANYPPDAYTTILAPLLPAPHLELLNSVFHTASSVAAFGETNGVSGSKLTRLIGWWLLSERPTPPSGLVGFLQEWDTAARILEHLFLAYVRDQQRLGLMPKRLTQLVKAYPYSKQASPTDQYYLPRPRFTTQQRTVLFVRAAVPPNAADFYIGRPVQLLRDAIVAPLEDTAKNAEYRSIWDTLKKQAITEASAPSSPADNSQEPPIVSITSLLSEGAVHVFTSSTGESTVTSPAKTSESSWTRFSSPVKKDSGAESTNTTAPVSPMEWEEFTGIGFAGGLQDSTTLSFSEFAPPPPKAGSATYGGASRSSRTSGRLARSQRSGEFNKPPRTPGATNGDSPPIKEGKAFPSKDASVVISDSAEPPLEIDEALIDGWADILTDREVSRGWPTFAIYELRTPIAAPAATETENDGESGRIRWLAIEAYVKPPPQFLEETSAPSSPVKGGRVKRSSSVNSEKRRRFGFFSSTTSLGGKDKDKDVKEDKKEKRKDHMRRASEISTDSMGKIKEPFTSTTSLAAPPPIKEEPEPTTPVKAPEENAVPDTAVTEEAFPKSEPPTVDTTLKIPAADGSRFVEGSTPGTIPESLTGPDTTHADHEDTEVATDKFASAAAATDEAAKAVLHELEQINEPNVPVSEGTKPVSDNTASEEISPRSNLKEEGQHETTAIATSANEVIDGQVDSQAHDKVERLTKEGEASQTTDHEASTTVPNPLVVVTDSDGQPALKGQEDVEGGNNAAANEEQARLDAERLEKERLEAEELERATKAREEAAQREIEELARQKSIEEHAELERLQALDAERIKQAELARLEAERLESEKIAAENAAREAQRLQEEADAKRIEEERIAAEAEAEARRLEEEATARRIEEERVAAEAEKARLAQEEADRLEQERLAELERARLAKEEADRLAAEAAALEAQRLQEEADAKRIEEERVAAEAEARRLEEEATAKRIEEERVAAEAEKARLAQEEVDRLEQERLAEIERERLAKEEADRLAAEAAALEAQRLQEEADAKRREEERIAAEAQAKLLEEARLAEEKRLADEAEAARLAAIEKARQEQEEADRLEQERLAEIERERLAKEESDRLAAEAAALEAQRLQEEAEAKRIEEERIATEAEAKRLEEEATARRIEEERAAAEAEKARLAQEEADKLEQERLAEIERERLAKEEADRLAAEAAALEAQRLQEEADAKRREEERIAAEAQAKLLEEARLAEEKRLADEAEAARLAAIEKARQEQEEADMRARLEEEHLAKIEQERLAKEEADRLAAEAAALEAQRLQEEADAKRIEEERVAAEAEAKRLEDEATARRIEEERVAAEAEKARLAQEEADRLEQERLAEIERDRLAKEEADRLAAEAAALEAQRLQDEAEAKLREEERIAAEAEAKRLEDEATARRIEEERVAAEAEKARLAQEEADKQAELEREQALEAERVAKEKADRLEREEQDRQDQLARENALLEAQEAQERARLEEEERARKEEARIAKILEAEDKRIEDENMAKEATNEPPEAIEVATESVDPEPTKDEDAQPSVSTDESSGDAPVEPTPTVEPVTPEDVVPKSDAQPGISTDEPSADAPAEPSVTESEDPTPKVEPVDA